MTNAFRKYIYPYKGKDTDVLWKKMGIKFATTICHTCKNRSVCMFRSNPESIYSECNFYEEKK